MSDSNLTIALLLGGVSPEREVSKATGKSILQALRQLNYKVKVLDPAYGLNQPEDENKFFESGNYSELSTRNYIEIINSSLFDDVDVAFIALHGKWGEDGTLQSLLEMRGIKYTGSKILASSLSMDKCMSKIMFQHYDVNTPKWFIVRKNEKDYNLIREKIKKFFGYPCVVKPNDQGSTIGLTICRGDAEVQKSIELAQQYSDKVLIEEYISGREVTVGIIGQQPLPVLEIKPKSGFYDYTSKYTSGMTEYEVPADIPKKVAEHLQHQALLAFNSIGCESYARVDFRLTNDFKSYCLEVNTLPGMTSTSLLPKMAKAAGISFDELIQRIINYALK
ncbi:MAG: D-alanine--D-alanine ligase [Melioribacter sp.]|uniref:D-alanine--D-alanine ligase family protein n=1 Tax=Rosettibacter primus TaxID=3111523 RepID=UPI00247DECB8|nr:D-alanine--D-alanine ligase [Melioribacter sp.]